MYINKIHTYVCINIYMCVCVKWIIYSGSFTVLLFKSDRIYCYFGP